MNHKKFPTSPQSFDLPLYCVYLLMDKNMQDKILLAHSIVNQFYNKKQADEAMNKWIAQHCLKNYKVEFAKNKITITNNRSNLAT